MAYEDVALPGPVDLRHVAEWTGASVDEIQALNPEIRRWTTPVRYPEYPIKVPVGTSDQVRARLRETEEADRTGLQWRTVKRGESLATIARSLKVRQADLAEANYLSTRARLTAGQQLIVPKAPATLPPPGTAATAAAPAVAAAQPPAAARLEARTAVPAPDTGGRVIYRVKSGDTLSGIARRYRTSVEALKTWNAGIQGTRIHPGDRLTIYTGRAAN